MIVIPNFETEFKGKAFEDATFQPPMKQSGTAITLPGSPPVLTCIGYGDNNSNGNPYFVGMYFDNGGVVIRTVLMKHAKFIKQ